MKLYIKNMVCVRCSLVVRSELEKLGFEADSLAAGEIEIIGEIPEEKKVQFRLTMQQLGLEVIDDRDSILIEKIKAEIMRLVSETGNLLKVNLSYHISSALGYSYNYLSTLFSTVQGSSIERYYILRKTERVKEMLIHDNLTFSEIAFKLHYSSVPHLSSQFKKETGLTLTRFRELGQIERRQRKIL
jgi:AraC-like DNA-binding protein